MKKRTVKHMFPVLILLGLFQGCSSPMEMFQPKPDITQFYFLESDLDEGYTERLSTDGLSVLVGTSSTAKYLDQNQIVTVNGPNSVDYAEYHRWGEPLQEGINRLLMDQVAIELETSRVTFLRIAGNFDWDYRIGYHVYQLGGDMGGTVTLHVSWWVDSKNSDIQRFDGSVYKAQVQGEEYSDYVRAIQGVVTEWAKDVSLYMADNH